MPAEWQSVGSTRAGLSAEPDPAADRSEHTAGYGPPCTLRRTS
ncbi:hypothetical protein [Brachybacterium tyrofermentans]|uniref:Uncharacterized protein n=1 Tax=Brachybacterium tyrofermentans TaxID=47848 RepID=A0ABW0FKU0_9MICO